MLTKHSLFRVIYSVRKREPTDEPSFPAVGARKTIVADGIQEAIDAVIAHEQAVGNHIVTISEVAREGFEVWS